MIELIDNLKKKIKNKVGLSIGEGYEVLRRMKQENKGIRSDQDKKIFKTRSIKDVDKNGQQRFLNYAMGLIKLEEPIYYNILRLRMEGCSHKMIAAYLSKVKKANITVARVQKLEVAAVKYMRAKIAHLRRTGTPLIGEPKVA